MSDLPDHVILGGAPKDPDMPDYVKAVYTSVKNTWQDAENLDDTHGYTSYIWIPEETFKVDVMKLAVWAEKFRAHSKSALAGGGTTQTSAGGGAHSHTVTGATSSYVTPSHTHDVNIGTKTSTEGGAHRHAMLVYESTTPGAFTNMKWLCLGPSSESLYVNFEAETIETKFTFSQTALHTHDVVIGTVTSASGGASHAHTVSGQTAEAVATHTHTVTLPDHTHEIDFGIYEEAITGRTLSAKLYDPDGNLLKDFGVVLTGEDNDIIDLSSYLETLKYGMYRLVLTASGKLRVRLLFYELCKMYAQY